MTDTHRDVADLIAAGATADDIRALVERAIPYVDHSSIVHLATADAGIPDSVEWWWVDHIPAKKMGLLDGDPDMGKSLINCSLIGSMTTGQPLPDGSLPLFTGGAVLFDSEDGYSDTIIPRLIAAGADLSRVLVAHAADYGHPIVLPRDLAQLERVIDKVGAGIVIFSPWEFYLDADILKGKEQREALEPFKRMVAERGIVSLGTRHLNQQAGQKAIYRGRGDSTGGAVSRYGFMVGKDPTSDTPDENFVMAPLKHNLAARSRVHAVRYQIEEVTLSVSDSKGNAIKAPRIAWKGVSEVKPDQLVGTDGAKRLTAKQILETHVLPLLKDGPIKADDGWLVMNKHGITSQGTVTPARKAVGILAKKVGMSGPWYWCLEGQTLPGQEGFVAVESANGKTSYRLRPVPQENRDVT